MKDNTSDWLYRVYNQHVCGFALLCFNDVIHFTKHTCMLTIWGYGDVSLNKYPGSASKVRQEMLKNWKDKDIIETVYTRKQSEKTISGKDIHVGC